jgi:hypothetical protein
MPPGPEDVTDFGARARAWAAATLPEAGPGLYEGVFRTNVTEEQEAAEVGRERQLQRMFYEAGFAGVCVPREYGGQGLTPDHQRALNQALAGYEFPARLQVPTFTPCLAILLEFGTEEQKRTHIPAMLRGEELWMQLLSEPGGGSDVAGALTSAVRDGDQWVLNGSKIWTTGAWFSDWGLCLARTNWDVPKHRGLTVFILPLRQPGLEIHRIEMLNGSREFCQEFLTDVIVPDGDRVGEVDEGWTVGVRWMLHERLLYESPLVTFASSASTTFASTSFSSLALAAGRRDDPSAQELVGEARMLDVVAARLQERIVMEGVRVLEVAEHTFVPAASALLADWGADVIKIEPIERGDAMRGLAATGVVSISGDVHALLEHSNRGKRSLALDLTTPEGSRSSTSWPPPRTSS